MRPPDGTMIGSVLVCALGRPVLSAKGTPSRPMTSIGRVRTIDIAGSIDRSRFRCGCVFGLWSRMVAHDQDSIGNPVLPPCIVVGVLDHDCAGQSEQGLGLALAMKMRVVPVQSRGLVIR